MSITSRAAGIVLRHTRDPPRCMRLTVTGRCRCMAMSETRVQDLPPFAGHSPDKDRPLGWYTLLISLFTGLAGGFDLVPPLRSRAAAADGHARPRARRARDAQELAHAR